MKSNIFFISLILSLVFCGYINHSGDDDFESSFNQQIDPLKVYLETFELLVPFINSHETPIKAHMGAIHDKTTWNCLAFHHPRARDILTLKRPKYVSNDDFTNEARILCRFYAFQTMFDRDFLPHAYYPWVNIMKKYLDVVPNVPSDREIVRNVRKSNRSPIDIGRYVGYKMIQHMSRDGSNFDGSTGNNGERCTANCVIYGDNGPKPYVPVNNPFAPSEVYGRHKPVVDSNGYGYLTGQFHTTPHLGRMNFTLLREPYFTRRQIESRVVPSPDFDLEKESLRVINSVRKTGTSDKRKMLSEVVDNKVTLTGIIFPQILSRYNLTFEEAAFFGAGMSIAGLEATILAWREKVRNDRVRPITFIKEWGLREINSWKGPYKTTGLMHAKDWASYFRTMPHSDYPSASACVCTMLTEYLDTYIKDIHNEDSVPIVFNFPAGSSRIEPGFTPKQNLTITTVNMSELRDICGNSRLWSGVHYGPSILAGYNLCEGVGPKGLAFMRDLLPGGYESLVTKK